MIIKSLSRAIIELQKTRFVHGKTTNHNVQDQMINRKNDKWLFSNSMKVPSDVHQMHIHCDGSLSC